MSTKKFGGPSPYSEPFSFPKVDLYEELVNNVKNNVKANSQSPPMGVALFGLGRIGLVHLPNIINNPRINLKYIVDNQPGRFSDVRKCWHLSDKVTLLTSKDAEKVFKDNEVKIVIVGSPTFTHEDIVIKALAANKDIFCEKPVAENFDNIVKCYKAAEANGRILFSAFNRRFDPGFAGLRKRAMEGAVGHIQILKVTSRDSPIPDVDYMKTSGGVFHDCLVHDFDIACYVLGELPIRVQASASALIPEVKAIDDFDTIAFLLTFPSGAVALGDNSRYSCYGYDQRLEVFGNKGMIKVENERPYQSNEEYLGRDGVKKAPIFFTFPERYKLAYAKELEHFLDVVQDGAVSEVTSVQTLAICKIATAAEESARTGRSVDLNWSAEYVNAFTYETK